MTTTHPTPLPAERPTAMFQCDGEYVIVYANANGEHQVTTTAGEWNVVWSDNRRRITYCDGNYYALETETEVAQ